MVCVDRAHYRVPSFTLRMSPICCSGGGEAVLVFATILASHTFVPAGFLLRGNTAAWSRVFLRLKYASINALPDLPLKIALICSLHPVCILHQLQANAVVRLDVQ